MYYDKRTKGLSARRASMTVKDFSAGINGKKDEENLSPGECVFSYNFNTDGGTLKEGIGVKKADFGKGPSFDVSGARPLKLYFYKKYNPNAKKYEEFLLIYASNGEMYSAGVSDEVFVKADGLYFAEPPYAAAYNYSGKDVMIFSAGESLKVFDGEKVTAIVDVPSVTSLCVHSERLFVTEGGTRTSLWFSDDFDPLNWKVSLDEAGFIDIREGAGSLIKAVSFRDYVYAFANYGIMRVTAYGSQTDFSVDGIAASSGRIYGDSIAVCGDRIVYLAEDGFYGFGGGTPYRIMSKLDEILVGIDNSEAKGIYYNGNYYCRLKAKADGVEREVLLKYDIHRGTFTLSSGFDIVDFIVAEGEENCRMLFLIDGKPNVAMLSDKAECFSVPLEKRWTSGKSDLGTTEQKRVTRLSLVTHTEIIVTLKSDRGSRLLHFFGSEERQSRVVGLRGDSFTVEIECNAPGAAISALKIEYEY